MADDVLKYRIKIFSSLLPLLACCQFCLFHLGAGDCLQGSSVLRKTPGVCAGCVAGALLAAVHRHWAASEYHCAREPGIWSQRFSVNRRFHPDLLRALRPAQRRVVRGWVDSGGFVTVPF